MKFINKKLNIDFKTILKILLALTTISLISSMTKVNKSEIRISQIKSLIKRATAELSSPTKSKKNFKKNSKNIFLFN